MYTLAICEFYQKNKRLKKHFFINPSKYYLPLWKNEQTLLKLHALPLNLLIEINKQQTAKQGRTPVFLVCFLQKAKANNKSVTLTLAPPAFMIMPTKISCTAMQRFSSNTSQLAIEVSFAMSLRLCTPFRKVIPSLTFK